MKEQFFDKAIAWAKRKSIADIRANHEEYEPTKVFTNQSTNEQIQPDVSYRTMGGNKHFVEIALKSERKQKLVTRWKLLSTMASMKRGKLHLFAPRGHKMFTKKLIEQYNIDAQILSL